MEEPKFIVVALPSGDLPFVFPMGMIDLVARLRRPVVGRYSDHLSDTDIRAAKIIVLPIHWHYSLHSAVVLSRRVKHLNPQALIISGGFTAGAYFESLLEKSEIDFIIRGDTEIPFVELVHALAGGGDPHLVPNVAWRGGCAPLAYQIDSRTLAESNNRDIAWFPEFERAALATQRLRDPAFLFPWVVVSRGCRFHCPDCFASPEAQDLLAGRGMVARPPEAVSDDLRYWSLRPDINWVYFNSDFLTTLGRDWAAPILDARHHLTAYYEWYRVPDLSDADRIIDAFDGAVFGFFLRPDSECAHLESNNPLRDAGRLRDFARHCRNRARIMLYVAPSLIPANPDYFGQTKSIASVGAVELKLFDESVIPPIATQSDEEKRAGFERLLAGSEKAAPRLAKQHAILRRVLAAGSILYSALWRVSLLRAWLRILARHILYHVIRQAEFLRLKPKL